MQLAGEVALVTGAGRGIGESVARALAANGAAVVLLSRTAEEIEKVAAAIRSQGGRALAGRADVSDRVQVQSAVADSLKEFGRIDILVNCAGVLGPIGPLTDNDSEEWKRTIDINLLGTVHTMRAVLPQMIEQRKGVIVNFSGGGAVGPFPRFSAYSASKAAVVRLTETVSEEVEHFGIRINAVAPGAVNTGMLDQVLEAGEAAGKEYSAKIAQKEAGGVPPERAAELVVFLASSASAGITGRLISAVWDDWRSLPGDAQELQKSALFTLRRIDGRYFREVDDHIFPNNRTPVGKGIPDQSRKEK